jgi:hypothetical protein
MMSRKDYITIAEAVAGALEMGASDYELLVERLSDVFERDNPKFDRERFEQACGLHYIR